jgi:DNA topoisomerase-2
MDSHAINVATQQDESHQDSSVPKSKSINISKKDPKTVEEIYQKKTQLEHILLRPDTYIGSAEHHQTNMWVLSETDELEYRMISFVPGLYKIFDEILVNAADNKVRPVFLQISNPLMSFIEFAALCG